MEQKQKQTDEILGEIAETLREIKQQLVRMNKNLEGCIAVEVYRGSDY